MEMFAPRAPSPLRLQRREAAFLPSPSGRGAGGEGASEDRDCVPCALIGALLAALVVTVLLKLMVFAPAKPLTLPLDATCSLSRETCSAILPDGGALEFTLGPRPTPLLKPLAVAVRIDGSAARAVEVDFSGVNLPMAFNRADLTQDGDGAFVGQANLPLCSTSRMEWRATVLLEHAGKKIYAPFRFETNDQPTTTPSS
jgi:hypothetical protein